MYVDVILLAILFMATLIFHFLSKYSHCVLDSTKYSYWHNSSTVHTDIHIQTTAMSRPLRFGAFRSHMSIHMYTRA